MAPPVPITRRLRPAAVALAVLGLGALIGWQFLVHWHPSASDYRFQGVSVSQAQGPIDWEQVHEAGADFAYVRATNGTLGRDIMFDDDWRSAFEAGLKRGAYLDYSLCGLAADQANLFNTVVPQTQDQLPPAIFIDFTDDCPARPERQVVVGEIARAMAMIENHLGRPAILKVSPAVEARYQLARAIPRPLWETGTFFPPDYAGRPWRLWQANARRRVPGIQTSVEWSVVANGR